MMTINFHGLVINCHKIIYADYAINSIRIYLEGLPKERPFVTITCKGQAEGKVLLEELDAAIHNHAKAGA